MGMLTLCATFFAAEAAPTVWYQPISVLLFCGSGFSRDNLKKCTNSKYPLMRAFFHSVRNQSGCLGPNSRHRRAIFVASAKLERLTEENSAFYLSGVFLPPER
jgi:hypothetical protein